MKRSISTIILFLFIVKGNNAQKIRSIEKEFPLNWSTEIGNVTYRTNLISAGNYLLIGSNGNSYRDYSIDNKNGLKVIDPKKGKVKRVILGESFGDVDVNGVIVHDNKIYFGNDNDEFVCVDILGNIQWRLPLSGDVEHEPIIIDNDNKKLIVFATETGELRAVNPDDGNTVWEYLHPKFKGWRQGDNRVVFKIKAHFTSGGIFFSKPAIADLNRDGVKDLIYSCNYEETRAINGANGKLLWKIQRAENSKWSNDGSYHNTPIIAGKGSNLKVLIPQSDYNDGNGYLRKINIHDRRGKFIKEYYCKTSIGNRGLNSLNISSEEVVIPNTTSTCVFNATNNQFDFIYGINLKYTYTDWQNKQQVGNRFSYDPLISNKLIKYKNEECIVVMFQEDYGVDDSQAVLSIIGLESKKVHGRYHLPSGSEFAPHISDVNGDGKLDLLVGCYDGRLYCYNMGISSRNLLTKEKKYSLSESTENNQIKIEDLSDEVKENDLESVKDQGVMHKAVPDKVTKDITQKTSEDDGDDSLSAANLYLISYSSLALLLLVGASIYLFRKNKEEDPVEQS